MPFIRSLGFLLALLLPCAANAADWQKARAECEAKIIPPGAGSGSAAWAAIAKCTAEKATHASQAAIARAIGQVNTEAYDSPMARDRVEEVRGKLAE